MNLTEIADDQRVHRRLLRATDVTGIYDMEIDSTTLSTYMTCPRSYMLYAVLGRDSGERDALNYGSGLHAVMETYFKLSVDDQPTSLPLLLSVLADHFQRYPCAPGSWRNLDHAIAAVRQWHQLRQQLPVWQVYIDDNGPYVERSFRIPLVTVPVRSTIPFQTKLILSDSTDSAPLWIDTIRVFFTGKIDLVIFDRLGKLRVVDHKTSSLAGGTFWGQFTRSPQMRGYTWAASRLLDERVPGVMIHALFGRKPSKTGNAFETETAEYDYTDESLADWHRSTTTHIVNIVDMLKGGQTSFPENAISCQAKYGQCAYHAVCNAPSIVQHAHLLSGAFADRTWSPLHT